MTRRARGGGWSRYPVEPGDDHPALTALGDDGGVLVPGRASRVVGLGAICGLRGFGDRRSQSFWVGEFAQLASGRRVVLHDERGFTIGSPRADIGDHETADTIERHVRTTVLPDDDGCDDHPWSWLAERARARGLEVAAEGLRRLPYDVVLTVSVTRWLARVP